MPAQDSGVVTIKVPFAVRKRGGRKLVVAPDGAAMPPLAPQIDTTLVKAIARAFRWQKMLETGGNATIKEIAKAEKINPSYVSRVLRLISPRTFVVARVRSAVTIPVTIGFSKNRKTLIQWPSWPVSVASRRERQLN